MDLKKLLELLKEHKVKFILIGAEAFPAYGWARATFDTDIFIEPTRENANRALIALKKFGYSVLNGLTVEKFLSRKTLIRQYLLPTDVHPFVKGVVFKDVWKNKIKSNIEGVDVYVPSINDMLKMKRAAGRAKDKEDIRYLTEIKRIKRKKK